MRYILILLFCALNLTASAQWWRGDFKKHPRLPLLSQPRFLSAKRIPKQVINTKLPAYQRPRSAYNLQVCEQEVIKQVQHFMRFREYDEASYKFSELAQLYVQENRLSEAKWYYLQSILISKRLNNFALTINSTMRLAMIKADLGDIPQAQADLAEARAIAVSAGRIQDVIAVDKKIAFVKNNTVWLDKANLRYAENADKPEPRTKSKKTLR